MGVSAAHADVVQAAVVADGDGSGGVDAVVSYPPGRRGAVGVGSGFGELLVDGGGNGSAEAAVGSVVVVDASEFVELGLQRGDVGGWGLGAEPAFEGLLEAFDFAAGARMVGP